MKILGIDTSTMTTSIALIEDEKILGQIMLNSNMSHSEHLMDTVDFLLTSSEVKIGDIDLFAVAVGPGSFTGIRIGIATVKSFVQSLKTDVVGVSTLEILAKNVNTHEYIAPVIDARRNRVYGAVYKSVNGILKAIVPEDIYSTEDFFERLEEFEGVVLVGEVDRFETEIDGKYQIGYGDSNLARASNLCIIAGERYARGEVDDPYALNANYMGKSQAQIDYEKRNGNV